MARPLVLCVAVALLMAGCFHRDSGDSGNETGAGPANPGNGDAGPDGGPTPGPGDGANESDGASGLGLSVSWEAFADVPTPRTEVAAAELDGRAWVIGGLLESGTATGAVEVYDPESDSWSEARSLPVPVHHAAAVAAGGRLFVLGGYVGLSTPTDLAFEYEPDLDLWTPVARMPQARGAHAAAVVGDRIVVAGGVGTSGLLPATALYDLAADSWTAGADIPTRRDHLAAVPFGGLVLFIAGRPLDPARNFAVVEAYDPGNDSWSAWPGLREPRGGIAAAVLDGRVFVFGGEEPGATIAPVEVYAPEDGRWHNLTELPHPRHGLGAVAFAERGAIHVLAGGEGPAAFASGWNEALRVNEL